MERRVPILRSPFFIISIFKLKKQTACYKTNEVKDGWGSKMELLHSFCFEVFLYLFPLKAFNEKPITALLRINASI